MKKLSSLLTLGLTTISLSIGYLLFNSSKEEKKVEALESNNIIYLDVSFQPAPFFSNLHCSVHDDNGHSYDVQMKKTPNYDSNHIYRLSLPNEYTYTKAYFYSLEEEGYELIHAETPSVSIPTDKKNMYVIDSGEWDNFIYQASGHWEYYEDDVPTEGDGYYLVGSKTDWKFKDAVKLTEGSHGDKAEIINYAAITNEEFYIRSYFNDEEHIYGEKYSVGESSKALNIFLTQEDNFVVEEYVYPPEFEGYYISGIFSGVEKWTYYDSIKMNNVSGDTLAEYRNLEIKKDDVMMVRDFSYDSHPWEKKASLSSSQDTTFGEISGNNFIFSVSGNYDVFSYMESDSLVFEVRPHAEAFTVTLTCLYYDGKTKVDMETIPSQTAYITEEFTPEAPSYEYKGFVGVYKDENCEFPYTPKILEANTHLYLKYLNDNYYCFTGKNDHGVYPKQYVLDTGIKMNNQNLPDESWQAEIYLNVEKENEEHQFGLVDKDLSTIMVATNTGWPNYWGHVEYSFVTFNYIFHKVGTYHIVITKGNQLIFKDAYGDPFINGMIDSIEVDEKNHVTTSLESLKAIWDKQKENYSNVEDKSGFTNIGFKYTENPTNDHQRFMNKYYLAIYRYGSSDLENFIFPTQEPVEPHLYQYKVTFVPGEGSLSPTEINVNENESINLPVPTRDGYSFVGWSLEGSEDIISSPYTVTDDVTFVAHYAPISKNNDIIIAVTVTVGVLTLGGGITAFFLIKNRNKKLKVK